MNTGKISARYAKALYEFAADANVADKVYETMKLVSAAFVSVDGLKDAIANPTISKDKKKELLTIMAGDSVCAEYTRFVDLVVENKREDYFQSIALVYQDLYRKKKNLVRATVVTACPISADEEKRFRQVLTNVTDADIDFDTTVDPALIGGFVMEVETYQLNASVKSQLDTIREKLRYSNSANVQC